MKSWPPLSEGKRQLCYLSIQPKATILPQMHKNTKLKTHTHIVTTHLKSKKTETTNSLAMQTADYINNPPLRGKKYSLTTSLSVRKLLEFYQWKVLSLEVLITDFPVGCCLA